MIIRIESLAGVRNAITATIREIEKAIQSGPVEIVIRSKKRTGPQNNLLQAMCGDLADKAVWHGQSLTKDEWRHLFVTGLLGAKVIPAYGGGFLSLIRSSKDLTEKQASDCIEMIHAWAAENGVVFGEAA